MTLTPGEVARYRNLLGITADQIPPARDSSTTRRTPADERMPRRGARGRFVRTGVTHGRVATYRNAGCRCDDCRAAHAAAKRRYVANARARRTAP